MCSFGFYFILQFSFRSSFVTLGLDLVWHTCICRCETAIIIIIGGKCEVYIYRYIHRYLYINNNSIRYTQTRSEIKMCARGNRLMTAMTITRLPPPPPTNETKTSITTANTARHGTIFDNIHCVQYIGHHSLHNTQTIVCLAVRCPQWTHRVLARNLTL